MIMVQNMSYIDEDRACGATLPWWWFGPATQLSQDWAELGKKLADGDRVPLRVRKPVEYIIVQHRMLKKNLNIYCSSVT